MDLIMHLIFQKLYQNEMKNNFNDIQEEEKYVQIVIDINR